MSDFYMEWIDYDIFAASGKPKELCQVMVFLQEMTVYWRFMLIVVILFDHILYIRGKGGKKCHRTASYIASAVTLAISCGLAAYFVERVSLKPMKTQLHSRTSRVSPREQSFCPEVLLP